MGALEQVTKLKNQGKTDSEIIRELSQNGISPKEITDALRQSQIKSAVSGVPEATDDMQPSIMPEEETQFSNQETPAPQQDYSPQLYEEQQTYQPAPENYVQQQNYYQPYQQQEAGYQGYAPSSSDTDTIIEIADQVFSDRAKKIQKQADSAAESIILLQTKMESVSDRLKKVEAIIDRLQLAILEKVGSYGNNLESIKKEMSMMQDSFSKMVSHKVESHNNREESAPSQTARKKVSGRK
jgi:hypothetical protein